LSIFFVIPIFSQLPRTLVPRGNWEKIVIKLLLLLISQKSALDIGTGDKIATNVRGLAMLGQQRFVTPELKPNIVTVVD